MLKLKYDLGHSPINIYLDRPSSYLEQLVEINAKLFIIGKYEGPLSSNYRKTVNITPDIYPHIIISQTKLENFDVLKSIAKDYGAKFIHWETSQVPSHGISKQSVYALKAREADVNIFVDSYLRNMWDFDENSSTIIYNGISEKYSTKHDQPFIISTHLPLNYILGGSCPIVHKTPYTAKYIQHGYNGFLFSEGNELGNIINKFKLMDKEDINKIITNSQKMVLENFNNKKFLTDWKNLLRSII